MKFYTWICSFVPGRDMSYPGFKTSEKPSSAKYVPAACVPVSPAVVNEGVEDGAGVALKKHSRI
jgi:hypothetical protein